ncbi:MAG: site-2 protease family protein [Acidobacteria bacterium]|nr:site-2 protease family protein [Acidobacteriota bacterium]
MRNVDWGQVALLVAVIVPSVILHEVAHGVVANAFGDDTAKRAGRLTLNPIAHVDPFGTLLLPVLLSLSGVGAFGYAKPVPVNPGRLRNPRRDSLYVSLAGPATNIALAAVATLLLRTLYAGELHGFLVVGRLPLVPRVLLWAGFLNVVLATFNLLPIPPLDGSALIERVLPAQWWPRWHQVRQYGFGILLLIIFLLPGALDRVFDPALRLWERFL